MMTTDETADEYLRQKMNEDKKKLIEEIEALHAHNSILSNSIHEWNEKHIAAQESRKRLCTRLAQMDKQMAPTQLRQSIKRVTIVKFSFFTRFYLFPTHLHTVPCRPLSAYCD